MSSINIDTIFQKKHPYTLYIKTPFCYFLLLKYKLFCFYLKN